MSTGAPRLEVAVHLAMDAEDSAEVKEALAKALRAETRLLRNLITTLRMQREGVAADDVEAVEDSVHAAHRILLTLSESRRRRRSLIHRLTGSEELPFYALEDAMGPRMTGALREAAAELQDVATLLAREIAINRQVLQTALQAGNDYVRALSGGPEGRLSYGADAGSAHPGGRSGVLINRQV